MAFNYRQIVSNHSPFLANVNSFAVVKFHENSSNPFPHEGGNVRFSSCTLSLNTDLQQPNVNAVYVIPVELSICILSEVITAEEGPKREFGGRKWTLFSKLSALNYWTFSTKVEFMVVDASRQGGLSLEEIESNGTRGLGGRVFVLQVIRP